MSRWASQSSKLVAGRAERAAVGSTPILSRLNGYRALCAIPVLIIKRACFIYLETRQMNLLLHLQSRHSLANFLEFPLFRTYAYNSHLLPTGYLREAVYELLLHGNFQLNKQRTQP